VCRSSGATVIRAVIIFADQMFEGGESMFWSASEREDKVTACKPSGGRTR